MKLEGKTVLVTGSGRNIGRATVLAYAREGANVVVNARSNRDEVESVSEEARALGVKALPVLADVSDQQQVEAMVAKALEEFGGVDVLISNAAVRPGKPFMEVTLEEWERVRSVILDGAFYCTRAVLPSMIEKGYGRIMYLSGDGAFRGDPERAHVSAPKLGLVGMARALATEMAHHNITFNVVSPGRIDTSRDLAWYPGQNTRDASKIPLQRLGLPDEVAGTLLFLGSDEGGYITGQTLHVNGGTSYF